jgi:DNA replication and repair protein RecF
MLKEIHIENIRSLQKLSLNLDSKQVFVVGNNGAGKTTVLEAVIFPFYGSVLGGSVSSMIRSGEKNASISLLFSYRDGEGTRKIEVSCEISGNSSISLLNRKTAKREELRERLPLSWYFPQENVIVLGGDEERREFLDQSLKSVDRMYRKAISEYSDALKNRNLLLKEISEGCEGKVRELEAVDEVVAKTGAEIVRKRLEALERIKRYAQEVISELLNRKLALYYEPGFKIRSENIASDLQESLYVSRETDLRMGFTTVGPHRDTIRINLEEKNARYQASYGERKLVALSLKIAQMLFIKEKSGRDVLFLIDDIFAELDRSMKERVVKFISEACPQFIATATELDIGQKIANLSIVSLNERNK